MQTLSKESVKEIMPTQGFNVKTLTHDGFKLNVWDIGGCVLTLASAWVSVSSRRVMVDGSMPS